jgi:hypothetical protein
MLPWPEQPAPTVVALLLTLLAALLAALIGVARYVAVLTLTTALCRWELARVRAQG